MASKVYEFPDLFKLGDIENKNVLKMAAKAHQALGELKGVSLTVPNQAMLINTLSLQEAKESSEIENIITTQDDLYQSHFASRHFTSQSAKEVHRYAEALIIGYQAVTDHQLITNKTIKTIQSTLEDNEAGFRKQAGTELVNESTGEVIFTPPQDPDTIIQLMSDLERFINNRDETDYDPLVKMALVHHQFESIHPFYDGNGRTGRIINILMLVQHGLLDAPVLYLSRYINQHKAKYYQLLQSTRTDKEWTQWLLFILEGVATTATETTRLIQAIKKLLQEHKKLIKTKLPRVYSHELINNLFRHPYTKIDFVTQECDVHRNTASRWLNALVELGVLTKHKIGNENYYLNDALFKLLIRGVQQ